METKRVGCGMHRRCGLKTSKDKPRREGPPWKEGETLVSDGKKALWLVTVFGGSDGKGEEHGFKLVRSEKRIGVVEVEGNGVALDIGERRHLARGAAGGVGEREKF